MITEIEAKLFGDYDMAKAWLLDQTDLIHFQVIDLVGHGRRVEVLYMRKVTMEMRVTTKRVLE